MVQFYFTTAQNMCIIIPWGSIHFHNAMQHIEHLESVLGTTLLYLITVHVFPIKMSHSNHILNIQINTNKTSHTNYILSIQIDTKYETEFPIMHVY